MPIGEEGKARIEYGEMDKYDGQSSVSPVENSATFWSCIEPNCPDLSSTYPLGLRIWVTIRGLYAMLE